MHGTLGAGRIDPNWRKYLSIFPLPNFTNLAISKGNYNYITNTFADKPVRQDILRLDYNVTEKWRTFFRGMNESVDNFGYNSPAANLKTLAPIGYKTHNPNVAFNAVFVATPTLVNELTAGTAYWTEDQRIADSDLAKIKERGRLLPKPAFPVQ